MGPTIHDLGTFPTHPFGRVALVGAGPGDPDLLTVKAHRLLREADAVFFDRLVHPTLLDLCRPDAERVDVGKLPGCHKVPQSLIEELLVEYARRGLAVVRLKGGDPFVFGRGGEEALALAAAGVPFEVVPGVSSAVAAPAYAGIPITHRGLAQHVTFVTGHPGTENAPVDWASMPRGGTLVILMGLKAWPEIARDLRAAGWPEATPAAAVQHGTTATQRVARATLGTLADRLVGFETPTLLVVGEVARLGDRLDWFRPAGAAAFGEAAA